MNFLEPDAQFPFKMPQIVGYDSLKDFVSVPEFERRIVRRGSHADHRVLLQPLLLGDRQPAQIALFLPEALLYVNGFASFATVNVIAVWVCVCAAHLCIALFSVLIAGLRPRAFEVALGAFAYATLVPWSLAGFYEGTINLSQWLRAARCSAARVGLLFCADIRPGLEVVRKDRFVCRDLAVFALSDVYAELRADLGISVVV